MGKKHKRQKQRNTFLVPLLVLGGILLIVAVDQQKIDYGDVKFGVEKTFAVKITNTGDGTLRFKEQPYIEVLEGC